MNKPTTSVQDSADRDNAAIQEQINEIRNRLLDRALVVIAIIIVPTVVFSLLRAHTTGWQPVVYLHIILGVLLPIAAILSRHFTLRVNAVVIFGSLFLGAVGGLLTYGLIGAGILILAIICLAFTILFGLRTGVIILLACILTIITTGVGVHMGFITYAFDFNVYATTASSWFAIVFCFALSIGFCVAITGLFYQYLIDALAVANRRSEELQQTNKQLAEEFKAHQLADEALYES